MTREEALAEAYRRGLLPPERRAAYEEAMRRGLVKPVAGAPAAGRPSAAAPRQTPADRAAAALRDARRRAQSTPGLVRAISQGTTLGNVVDAGGAALETAASNLFDRVRGRQSAYGPVEAFQAVRQSNNEAADRFRETNPVTSFVGNTVGAVGAAAAGGLTAAGRAVGGFATGTVGGKGLLGAGFRAAAVGAPTGAVGGLLLSSPGDEVADTASGALFGLALGAAAPAVGSAVSAAGRRVGNFAKRGTNNLVTAAGGSGFLDPKVEAQRRLVEAMKDDGLTPDAIQATMQQWAKAGGTAPALLDLVPRGGKTQNLIRGAALKAGPARIAAAGYNERLGRELPDAAVARARQLTPGTRKTAAARVDQLERIRNARAARNYAAPYAEQVDPAPFVSALEGDTGREVIGQARVEADRMMMNPNIRARIPQLTRLQEALDEGVSIEDLFGGAPPSRATGFDMAAQSQDASVMRSLAQTLREAEPGRAEPPFMTWLRRQGGISTASDRGDARQSLDTMARTVMRKNGRDLDDLALRAWEDGFFPGMDERPTRDQFLDLLDRAARGEDILSVDDLERAAIIQEREGIRSNLEEMVGDNFGSRVPNDRQINTAAYERGAPVGMDENVAPLPGVDLARLDVGTLDRIRIALNNQGQALQAAGTPGKGAAGYFKRAKAIEDELARRSPGYAAAVKEYAATSADIEAVGVGQRMFGGTTDADDLRGELAPLLRQSPRARANAAIGYRDELVGKLGTVKPGATGTFTDVAVTPNQIGKQDELFGPAAAPFRQSIENMTARARNAAFIDAGMGSKTSDVMGNTRSTFPNLVEIVMSAIAKVQRGIELTDAERLALVEYGTQTGGNAQSLLRRIAPPQRPYVTSGVGAPLLVGATAPGRSTGSE